MEILRAMETMSSQQFGFLSLTIIFKCNQYFGNKNYETETETVFVFEEDLRRPTWREPAGRLTHVLTRPCTTVRNSECQLLEGSG